MIWTVLSTSFIMAVNSLPSREYFCNFYCGENINLVGLFGEKAGGGGDRGVKEID